MSDTAILVPVVGMFLLTFLVWTYLYIRRIGYMRRERIHPQAVRSPEQARQLIPEEFNYPANNLANLTELPVVFYVLCLLLYATGMADAIDVAVAWGYFLLRAVHSAIRRLHGIFGAAVGHGRPHRRTLVVGHLTGSGWSEFP